MELMICLKKLSSIKKMKKHELGLQKMEKGNTSNSLMNLKQLDTL